MFNINRLFTYLIASFVATCYRCHQRIKVTRRSGSCKHGLQSMDITMECKTLIIIL